MTYIIPVIYALVLLYTTIRILLDTESTPKTLAYLLLVFLIPGIGIIFYYSVGINYRHQRSNSLAQKDQERIDLPFQKNNPDHTKQLVDTHKNEIAHFEPLVHFVRDIGLEPLCPNGFKVLVNGEEKFPEVLRILETAERFIHMEYYDWENDVRGNQIKEVLLKKVAKGVKVRVLYDDYASRLIKHNIVKELKQAGVEIYPRIKVKLVLLANRMNHRDHRKVILVDGKFAFVGGINISDRYDNSIDTGLFWRDTHTRISGPLSRSMQRHFIVSWNSASHQKLTYDQDLFPEIPEEFAKENQGTQALAQIVAGGPIYPRSNIMMSYFKIFSTAREKLYITNPYFIPSESILNAMIQAAYSGVDVRLMVPEKSDSAIVGAASRFYFDQLLNAGVRIFLYKKGFVHAKTVVADGRMSVIGTANMDIRSFDLNFEIMSIIYGTKIARQMEDIYMDDLKLCDEITLKQWNDQSTWKKLVYAIARLVSSFL